jgi:hypothetical protein
MWIPYKLGMPLIDRRIRIAGRPGEYNEGMNYYDTRTYRLPAGLIGVVQSISPFKIKFDRNDENYRLWPSISPPWTEHALYARIHPTRLLGLEIEV